MLKSLLINLLKRIARLDPFEVSIMITIAIALNLIVLVPSARSTASYISHGIGVDLSTIGIVILLGIFLTATTTNLWVRFIGKLPYWLFTLASVFVALHYELPLLGPTLYAGPAITMFIHWLKGALANYEPIQHDHLK